MNFKITDYESLKKSRKERQEAIELIEENFVIAQNISQTNVTHDLLNIIKNKLNQIKIQKSNESIKTLELKFESDKKSISKKQNQFRKEKEDILALLTSGINQKKRVMKVIKTDVETPEEKYEKYITYLSNDVQFELTNDSHIELSKRYIFIEKEEDEYSKKLENAYENFDKEIDKLGEEYVKDDFTEEFKELSLLSKQGFFQISQLEPKTFINFYGSKEDFKKYRTNLEVITKLVKEIEEIDKKDNKEFWYKEQNIQ